MRCVPDSAPRRQHRPSRSVSTPHTCTGPAVPCPRPPRAPGHSASAPPRPRSVVVRSLRVRLDASTPRTLAAARAAHSRTHARRRTPPPASAQPRARTAAVAACLATLPFEPCGFTPMQARTPYPTPHPAPPPTSMQAHPPLAIIMILHYYPPPPPSSAPYRPAPPDSALPRAPGPTGPSTPPAASPGQPRPAPPTPPPPPSLCRPARRLRSHARSPPPRRRRRHGSGSA
jgi:hypothetical protein